MREKTIPVEAHKSAIKSGNTYVDTVRGQVHLAECMIEKAGTYLIQRSLDRYNEEAKALAKVCEGASDGGDWRTGMGPCPKGKQRSWTQYEHHYHATLRVFKPMLDMLSKVSSLSKVFRSIKKNYHG